MKQKKSFSKSTHRHTASAGYIQLSRFQKRATDARSALKRQVAKRPFGSFIATLALLVAAAVVGSYLRRPDLQTAEPTPQAIQVPVLTIGEQPVVGVPATVQKTGVVKLNAQSGGIVQKVLVQPGDTVKRGQQLLSLSLGYAGGSPQNFQRQIAEKSFANSTEQLPQQLELIAKRREVAQHAETQAAELRAISRASLDDTRAVISLNEQLLTTVDALLATAEASGNTADVQTYRSTKAGLLSGLSALRSGLRATEYQANEDQEPAAISRVSRDMTLKQLDLEERGAKLSVEIAELNFRLARFSESLLYPASPCTGVVERVYVQFGQSINPGNPVVEVVCHKTGAQVIGLTNEAVARKLLQSTDGVFRTSDGATVSAQVLAVSTQPTDGPLFSITAVLNTTDESHIADATHGVLELPVSGAATSASVPFVPLDALYQTQTQSFVYVVAEENGTLVASLREVKLGSVFNTSVEVLQGISNGDRVILSRSVSAGDLLAIEE